jgi:hypothetical protein
MHMKTTFFFSSLLLAGFCFDGTAQPANEGLANRIIAGRTANAAMMKQYSWTCREEFTENGNVVDTRIDSVANGMDGTLQRTILNDDKSPLPRGFLRRRIAEKKREDVEKYLVGLRKLLDQYTLPTAGKIIDFVSQATDANGLLQLSGTSVVVPGDSFTLWVFAASQKSQKVQITSTFNGDSVAASASFLTLASGLNHIAYAELEVPAKGYRLQIHNFNYNQNN